MSDDLTGATPDEGTPVHDAELDALLAPWAGRAPERIDVEAALAKVTARRQADASPVVIDDLAARRAATPRVATPLPARAPLWQRAGFRAAAGLALVVGSVLVWRTIAAGPSTPTSFATAMGETREVTLSDGTAVRLGPGSSLDVAADYGRGSRDVTLHGEAWFEVEHDDAMPFAIRVGETLVEDLGTAFQVRESASSGEVSVRVTEGIVRLRRATAVATDSAVTLQAGDGAVASAAGIVRVAGAVSPAERTALEQGRLTFTDATMAEVRESLRRWYGVTLVMNDPALETRHVTADFTDEPITRVSAVLGLTLGVSADTHGDTITLRTTSGVSSRP